VVDNNKKSGDQRAAAQGVQFELTTKMETEVEPLTLRAELNAEDQKAYARDPVGFIGRELTRAGVKYKKIIVDPAQTQPPAACYHIVHPASESGIYWCN